MFPHAERDGSGRHPIGEVWTLVTHPRHTSVVANGPLRGRPLDQLIREARERYLGRLKTDRFPLLVKFIDAATDLSVQIHPDDAYSRAVEGDYGKSEAWYILHAPEDGRIISGHRFASREEYFRAVAEGRVESYLLEQPITPGELVYIPSRTVHALLGGTTVIEIQQPSDVTYRIYDWDRIDVVTGKPRELHIEKAADVIRYGDDSLAEKSRTALHTPFFTIERHALKTGGRMTFSPQAAGLPEVIVVAEGPGILTADGVIAPSPTSVASTMDLSPSIRATGAPMRSADSPDDVTRLALAPGDTLLIPADVPAYTVQATGTLIFLRTVPGFGGDAA
ncbi:MAG: class I mannose-6-phosphate isomerase [Hydrogenibacillus sp.]|nr:class I mannose-6-phosphate isomerase [Hydrogenibacillus sp.]